MNDSAEASPDEEGEPDISVRRLAPSHGLTSRRIRGAVRAALGDRAAYGVSVAVVDDPTIASLHERYLGDPEPTDVLAFDLREDADAEAVEGEIVVSSDTARRQADGLGLDPGDELLRYVIHGTLHLLGYVDGTSRQRCLMRREEDRILALLNGERDARRSGKKRQGECGV